MGEEDVRIIRGQMKWFDTYRTDNGEGKPLCILQIILYDSFSCINRIKYFTIKRVVR